MSGVVSVSPTGTESLATAANYALRISSEARMLEVQLGLAPSARCRMPAPVRKPDRLYSMMGLKKYKRVVE